jgi:AraC-like DNA-binding protein
MGQPTTAGAWLNSISEMLVTIGLDAKAIFDKAGIDAAAVQDPHNRFESDQLSRLWNVIAETTGNPAIGLASSDRPRPSSLDMLTYTMMTAPNLLGALQRFVRYVRIISDATTFTLEDGEGGQWMRLSIAGGELPVPRQRYEFILITILNICRWIASKTVNPLLVELAHDQPLDTAPYASAFACPVRYNAAEHGVLFATQDLDKPLPFSNSRLAEFHERFTGEFLRKMDSGKISTKVRELIMRAMPDGDPQRSAIAADLCISERTLQRRLSDEGTTFQDILDETRRDMARQFLADDQITLGQIAFMLGFADQSAFNRACQRWFTLSPRQFRKKLAGDQN